MVRNIQSMCSNLAWGIPGCGLSFRQKAFFDLFEVLQNKFWTGIGYIDVD